MNPVEAWLERFKRIAQEHELPVVVSVMRGEAVNAGLMILHDVNLALVATGQLGRGLVVRGGRRGTGSGREDRSRADGNREGRAKQAAAKGRGGILHQYQSFFYGMRQGEVRARKRGVGRSGKAGCLDEGAAIGERR